ncbi:MAG: hypothetical protein HONBIEJF_02883 [Fimbriimonadaceae bacterium]|nr:hypothetical protein [Fimbriimonadaceae bacterium]
MFQLWDDEITPEATQQTIDRLADEIVKRGLQTPAVFFLESHKPLHFFGSMSMVGFSPFLVPFVGFDNVNNWSRIMAKRENIEMLIQRIEERSSAAPPTEEGAA